MINHLFDKLFEEKPDSNIPLYINKKEKSNDEPFDIDNEESYNIDKLFENHENKNKCKK